MTNPVEVLCFLFLSLFIGIATTFLISRFLPIPYTVVIFLIGTLFSFPFNNEDPTIHNSLNMWYAIDPELILFVFLPALLFGESMSLKIHDIRSSIGASCILAGPGALFGALAMGVVAQYCFPFDWSWSLSCILGVILCPTDPVAVVALVKKLGASTKLTYLITGESLLNDATALVLYNMFFSRIATTNSRIEFSLQGIVIYFLQVVLISPLIGLAFGIGSVCCIGLLNRRMQKEDTIMQISVSLCCAYLSFFVAEFNLGVSGVLSCCTAGIVLSALAPPLIFEPESMHSVWSMIEWAGNTLIFMLAGLIIGEHCISFFSWINLGYLLLLYVLLFTVRAIVIGLSSPFLHLIGIDLNANEMAFMTWGGLRGAVSMTLALSLSNSIARNQTVLDPHSSDIVFFFIGGIVAMTLLFNATTCGFLLKWLCLIDLDHSAEKVVMLSYLKTRLRRKVDHLISELKREHSTLFQEEQLDVFCSLMSNSVDSLDSLAKRRRKEDRANLIPDTHTERPSDLWETSFGYHTRSTTTSSVQQVSSRDMEAAQPTDSTDEMTAPLKQKLSLRTGSNTPTTEYPFSRDVCMKIRKVFLQVIHVSYWKQIKAGKLPRHSLAALILLGAQDKASEMNFLANELMDWHIIFNSYKFIFSADDSGTEYDDIEDSASSRGTDFQSGETVVAVGNERSSNLDRLDAPLWSSSRALRCYFCRNQFIRAKSLINAFLVSQMVHILLGFIEAHEFAQKNIPQYMSGTEEADTVEQVRVVDESKTLVDLARSRLAQTNSKLLQEIVKKQSASRIFHMEEDVIEEFSREGLLSTSEAEHLLRDVQRAAAAGRRK